MVNVGEREETHNTTNYYLWSLDEALRQMSRIFVLLRFMSWPELSRLLVVWWWSGYRWSPSEHVQTNSIQLLGMRFKSMGSSSMNLLIARVTSWPELSRWMWCNQSLLSANQNRLTMQWWRTHQQRIIHKKTSTLSFCHQYLLDRIVAVGNCGQDCPGCSGWGCGLLHSRFNPMGLIIVHLCGIRAW